jgi:alanine-glyoxylate transaminase/serine-glyoxylate transaminase/serine-pyruvate transaminase
MPCILARRNACPVPGLSPVTFSEKAQAAIRGRGRRAQSWFLDLELVMAYWGEGAQRSYHHTAPINALYALHEALVILKDEGLPEFLGPAPAQSRSARRRARGAEHRIPVDAREYRLPQLNCVRFPAGVDDARGPAPAAAGFSLEIGAGLGPLAGKVWRIGLMGYASNKKNVLFCLGALEAVLAGQGVPVDAGEAVSAARAVYTAAA